MLYPRTSPLSIWIILYTFLLASVVEVLAARLPDIYWNATNPIFRIDNTDHIIDVNRGNVAYEYDQINIICPVYSSGTREEDVESYIIYNVSKEEFDSCHIGNPEKSRTIAVCDKPFTSRYFTITFRPFTPQPGGLEFRPGQDYYFIALSAKKGETNPTRHCQKYHMKVVFKVCCKKPPSPLPIIPRLGASSSTVAPSTSRVSTSTPSSYPEPNLPPNATTSTYQGVIIPGEGTGYQIKTKVDKPQIVPQAPRPTPRPPYPPYFPRDPPYPSKYPETKRYPPYNPTKAPPLFKHPSHPTVLSTRSPGDWWKPHSSRVPTSPYYKEGIYPPGRGRHQTNEITAKISSGTPAHRLTWTICIVGAASAIWSHHWRSAWLS